MELEIKMSFEITDEHLNGILDTAFEGGINYWCSDAEETGSFAYTLYDHVDDTEWSFNKEDLLNGIRLYIINRKDGLELVTNENGKMVFNDWNLDADIADQIIQYACMGKVRYG